jgi:hypothetical protein
MVTNQDKKWRKCVGKMLKKMIKGILIVSTCAISLVAPITLPIFAVVSIYTGSMSYMLGPFIILDLKTIITFIIES